MPRLAATFFSHANVRPAPPVDGAALEDLLTRAWERARQRWPTVTLPAETFVKHVAERLPPQATQGPLEPVLAELSLEELYLACACVRGLPSALAAFDKHYISKLRRRLRDPRQPDATIEDTCQKVRIKLLVPTPESAPKIAEYAGRGTLMSWVQVIAGRIHPRPLPPPPPPPDPLTLPGDKPDNSNPETTYIEGIQQAAFRQALGEAISALSDDERRLLRLYFSAEQPSMYAIALLFGVNQATISRRLKDVRQRIYKDTRRRLLARLGLSPDRFTSVLRGLGSRVDLLNLSQLIIVEHALPQASKKD